MQSAVREHDEIVREALEANGGYIFKTLGDGFCAVFERPGSALAAARDAQLALAEHDFAAVGGVRVRMALHSGFSDERDGDYFGPTVNRAARLVAIAHGGQVLASGTTADLLRDTPAADIVLRDLGQHRLKDLARPERVYQLLAPGLPEHFPPLRSLDVLANNIPRQLSSFFDAASVIPDITSLVAAHPLVTLAGAGGAGKTRSAVQVGADLVDGSGDGVWFVELAPLSNSLLVPAAIAKTLGVPESANRPVVETLVTYLRRKRLLLIIDNCEHVLDEVCGVIAAILRNCPDVRVLATSREALNIAGERVYRIPSLPFPPAGGTLTADSARTYAAIELFADRAQSHDTRFTLTDQNAAAVGEICRRLDGIPLAIELAAARTKMLGPRQLAEKLDERFTLLTRGDRTALPRQQTMRALIDWSYDLLAEAERRVFRRLAVFAGTFALDVASAVCADDSLDRPATFEILAALVDKSLIQAQSAGDGNVYRLLESTRAYAREKLDASGEMEATASAHALAYTELAERLSSSQDTISDRLMIAQTDPELENWRTAVAWTLGARHDVVLGMRMVTALGWMGWTIPFSERQRWIDLARAAVDDRTPPAVVAALDLAEAVVCAAMRRYPASLVAAQRGLARFTALGDDSQIAEAQRQAGLALMIMGRTDEGEPLLMRAVEARALFSRRRMCMVLQTLAYVRRVAGDFDAARRHFHEAIESARSVGAEIAGAGATLNLAETEYASGDTAQAADLASEALRIIRSFRSQEAVPVFASDLAAYLIALDRFDEAADCAREVVLAARELEDPFSALTGMHHLVAIAALSPVPAGGEAADADSARLRTATRLLGYVDARLAAMGAERQYTEQRELERLMPVLERHLDAQTVAQLRADGRTMTEADAFLQAAALER